MTRKLLLRVGPFLVAVCAALAGLSIQAADTLRPEVGKPLQAAQDLIKQQKYKEALSKIDEADAVPNKTAYELTVTERMRGTAALAAGLVDVAAKSFDQVLGAQQMPAADQQKLIEAVAAGYYRAKDYAKAAEWGERYRKAGGSDPAINQLLSQSYYLAGNYPAAAAELKDQIAAEEKAGRTPAQDQLELLASSYLRQNDNAGYVEVLQQLVTYYPKKEYWADLLARIQRKPGFSDRLSLDVYRLMLVVGSLQAADYMDMAQLALQAGFPIEAQKVIAAGYASKALGAGAEADRQKRLKDLADKDVQDDRKGLDSDAQAAQGKDANAMVNIGYNLTLYGKADEGIGLMEKGLAKGGLKHPEEAKLHLGLAYFNAGNKAKALQTFKSVQGGDGSADIARLWTAVASRS